ncbi:MAG TPA: DUF1697 domain-containing protein, partial [Feifaniaceae bacterium]|nr:DUF1697 domain-containing protein [Feifaniaceae bacterium]
AVLRTADELHALVRDCPFTQEQIDAAQTANLDGESFYVCLLSEQPDEKALTKLASLEQGRDRYVLSGRTIYLLLTQSVRTSQLAIRLNRIFPNMTSRNWNTTTKLNELSLS